MTDLGPQLAVEGGAQAFYDLVDTAVGVDRQAPTALSWLGMHLGHSCGVTLHH